jgi:predicted amino acid-binding ACT domain protein
MVTAKKLAGILLKFWRFKMAEENVNIVEVVRTTAKNMYEMLMQLAGHIEALENENSELKAKLSDDFK